jgi:hypothetical protein
MELPAAPSLKSGWRSFIACMNREPEYDARTSRSRRDDGGMLCCASNQVARNRSGVAARAQDRDRGCPRPRLRSVRGHHGSRGWSRRLEARRERGDETGSADNDVEQERRRPV